MELSRYITERAGLVGAIIVVALTLYGGTAETPPRHPQGITTIEEYR